jgi:hypothetical protein
VLFAGRILNAIQKQKQIIVMVKLDGCQNVLLVRTLVQKSIDIWAGE